MSQTRPSDIERAGLRFMCEHCWVRRGEWCVTRNGRLAGYLHGSRYDQVREIEELSGSRDELRNQFGRITTIKAELARLRGDVERWIFRSNQEIVERVRRIEAL